MATSIPIPRPRTTPLSQHVLKDVEDLNGIIGHGSYAIVKKLKFRGLECVGKKMHDILYQNATPPQREDLLTRFRGECELLSRLHHPCIVQFMGVYFEEDTPLPVLVMERLHSTLAATIDRYGVLPDQISYGILCDVSLGLRYLHEHSPPIVHRDLSANNVLLTPHMSGKISDLGVAKILNLSPAQMSQLVQTKAPGTPCYMPPEALSSRPKYNTKIDIYSMGVMLVHVFCGEWPFPTDVFQPDPLNPHKLVPVTEVNRRAEFFLKIADDHPLLPLMRSCLNNNPSLRPVASQIHTQLVEVKAHLQGMAETRIQMYKQLQSFQEEMVGVKKALNQRMEKMRREKDAEIEALKNQIKELSLKTTTESSERTQQLLPLPGFQWKQYSDIPVKCSRMQSVVIDDDVYVGGGVVKDDKDAHTVFKYSLLTDKWTRLIDHCVFYFGLCQFQRQLVSVGGALITDGQPTNKVYRYNRVNRKWVEHLKPLLINRAYPALLTTPSHIIACGGRTNKKKQSLATLSVVEVYSSKNSLWLKADPLPQPCTLLSSASLGDWGYLLGGCDPSNQPIKSYFSIDMAALIARASDNYYSLSVTTSIWKTLPDAPLATSTLVPLKGNLLTVGGQDGLTLPSVYTFLPSTNSWMKLSSGDLPVQVYATTAIPLPDNRLMVIGGKDKDGRDTSTMFIGSIIQCDYNASPEDQVDEESYLEILPDGEDGRLSWSFLNSDQKNPPSKFSEPASNQAPRFYLEKVRAIYDYIQADDEELTFKEGDIIYVVEKNDPYWHIGVTNHNGVDIKGSFPVNHVEVIS